MEIKIESLGRSHNRDRFDCGSEELNDFLKRHSFQNQKNHINRTFVAIDSEQNTQTKEEVLGFYTLSTGQVGFETLPNSMKHPKYPVSIIRLARLAVNQKHQGMKIGKILLHDALQKAKNTSKMVGVFAIVVDAKDTKARLFYEQYGFIPLQKTGLTLCLSIKDLQQL